MKNPVRIIWIVLGFLCLGLGSIGIAVPMLPTVPFYMGTVFCFTKSSKKLHDWFLTTNLYKKHLAGYIQERTMTIGTKLRITGMVTVMMLISFFCMKDAPVGRVCLMIVWLWHLWYFFLKIKTKKNGKAVKIEKSKYIIFQIVWKWLSLLCQIGMIYGACALLEGAFVHTLTKKHVLFWGTLVFAAVLLRFFCDRQATYAAFQASVDVKRVLREKIYEKLLKLGASYREHVATSEVVQMAAEGVEQLETYFGRYLSQLFYSLLAPLTLFGILAFVNIKASVVLLLCVPLIPVSIVAVQKLAKKLLNKYWGIYTELGDSFLENLQGLTTLKIYKADAQRAVRMDEESQRFRQITMKVLTMQLNSTSVMDIIAYGGAAVGMVVTVSEYGKGNVSLAGALMIILLASEFFIPLRLLGSFFHIAMNGMAASDKIFALLDLPEPEEEGELLEHAKTGISLNEIWFSYEKNRDILKGVSMDIPAGSLVSLVGTSGCGKSTIAGMLMKRKKGYQGSITIQGRELKQISEKSLMEQITLVSHNSYLFKGTVRENLKMGKENASEQEMCQVLSKVNLLEFLQSQQGLDTVVMEKGSNFSGGQCQRLAMARALLHDTPVYIFDEATSNIDRESEEMIMEVIRELSGKKTVILISHRLANVVGSDRIYMLENGSVVQSGTHSELMASAGSYKKLYCHQRELEAYGDEPRKVVAM